MTTTLNRRTMLRGALAVGAGVCFPWSLAQASLSPTKKQGMGSGLERIEFDDPIQYMNDSHRAWRGTAPITDADRALTNIARGLTKIDQIQVHPLFHEHMSITHIDGVKVRVIDFYRTQMGESIPYYYITHELAGGVGCGTGCILPPDHIEEWARFNVSSEKFIGIGCTNPLRGKTP